MSDDAPARQRAKHVREREGVFMRAARWIEHDDRTLGHLDCDALRKVREPVTDRTVRNERNVAASVESLQQPGEPQAHAAVVVVDHPQGIAASQRP